ncbi:MAG: redoxin domain-containing protein [Mariniblastus sp.]
MRFSFLIAFALLAGSLGSVATAQPVGFNKLEIGASIPDFDLPGVDDKNHKPGDYADSDVLMIVFTCNHCPTAQAYEARLNQIQEDYGSRGVTMIAISPNDPVAVRLDELGYSDLGDTLEDMKVRAKDANFKFPYLFDGETQKTSLAFGVLATPHVFIFDKARKLRYKGRIDDSEVKTVTSHDARNALDALLEGKEVPVPVTRVFGCSTKWSDKRASAETSIKKWNAEPVEISMIEKEGLAELVANKTDKYRLINVWATWCAPCVEELPEFVTINRMYRNRNFEMITVSADEPGSKDAALKVLKKNHVAAKNLLFNSDKRDDLFDAIDSKWEGGVPYTILVAPGGEIVYRQHDSIDVQVLKRKIADCVGRTYASREVKQEPPKKQTKEKNSGDEKIKAGKNFDTENLVAWCIVPFDAKNRGPAERAKMVRRLGLKRVAYDWRQKHISEFEQEILEYKANGIEYFAFWNWHDSMGPLIKKHEITPQIWNMPRLKNGLADKTESEKVKAVAENLLPAVEKAKSLGLKFGIYNHGGWAGEPKNLIAVCEYLRNNHDSPNVGIVYNFHHGHADIATFEKSFTQLKPYLICLNLNGMAEPETVDPKTKANKIVSIGMGVHERKMIQVVVDSGYDGPIGVLGHRKEMDAEKSVGEKVEGLKNLVEIN